MGIIIFDRTNKGIEVSKDGAIFLGYARQVLEPNVLQHLNLLSVFPKEYYKHIFRIWFPTAIQGSIYCFISMVLTRMVSGYGAAAIATQRVGGQIESDNDQIIDSSIQSFFFVEK